MYRLLPLIFLLLLACSKKINKPHSAVRGNTGLRNIAEAEKTGYYINVKTLEDFFNRCMSDIIRAKKVIVESDIVKMLTHFQNMNAGGKRYYILEKENITSMIEAVTKNVYSDFILINKKGRIIYTRSNDDIFSKNVRTHLVNTPLSRCYENRKKGIYVEDVSTLRPSIENHSMFISIRVGGGNSYPGIFVLQFNPDRIKEILNDKTEIIGRDNRYRISYTMDNLLSIYRYSDKIDMRLPSNKKDIYSFSTSDHKNFDYKFFNFKNLNWIVVKERN